MRFPVRSVMARPPPRHIVDGENFSAGDASPVLLAEV
jgi:hypothetical protein